MRKFRGFRLGKRLIRISRWILRRTRKPGYRRLSAPSPWNSKPITKILNWGRCLRNKTKLLCSSKLRSGYVPIGEEPVKEKPVSVPKGHLAVYVGQKDDDFHRVLVPVIYFNHPLFGELLREAEEEYGFSHEGGITIPCPFSEFESVKTRIDAAACGGRRMTVWKRHSLA